MFKITRGKGFHVKFANGYTVSVQFGPGNYCDHYNTPIGQEEGERLAGEGSVTAELAVWGPDGEFIDGTPLGIIGGVTGYSSAKDMLRLMQWAEEQPAKIAEPA